MEIKQWQVTVLKVGVLIIYAILIYFGVEHLLNVIKPEDRGIAVGATYIVWSSIVAIRDIAKDYVIRIDWNKDPYQ